MGGFLQGIGKDRTWMSSTLSQRPRYHPQWMGGGVGRGNENRDVELRLWLLCAESLCFLLLIHLTQGTDSNQSKSIVGTHLCFDLFCSWAPTSCVSISDHTVRVARALSSLLGLHITYTASMPHSTTVFPRRHLPGILGTSWLSSHPRAFQNSRAPDRNSVCL